LLSGEGDCRLGADDEGPVPVPRLVEVHARLKVFAPGGVKVDEDPLHDDGLGRQLVLVAGMPLSLAAGQGHELGQLEEAVELPGGPLGISDVCHGATLAGRCRHCQFAREASGRAASWVSGGT
jgi:hypothetical protein